jgi:hypothetical protein
VSGSNPQPRDKNASRPEVAVALGSVRAPLDDYSSYERLIIERLAYAIIVGAYEAEKGGFIVTYPPDEVSADPVAHRPLRSPPTLAYLTDAYARLYDNDYRRMKQ